MNWSLWMILSTNQTIFGMNRMNVMISSSLLCMFMIFTGWILQFYHSTHKTKPMLINIWVQYIILLFLVKNDNVQKCCVHIYILFDHLKIDSQRWVTPTWNEMSHKYTKQITNQVMTDDVGKWLKILFCSF